MASEQHPVLKNSPTLQDVQVYINNVVKHRGFDKETAQDSLLMLCEEVGELAKAVRKGHTNIRTATDSEKFKASHEAADVLWMLVCVCNKLGIDLEAAIREKEEHNKKRKWE